MKKLWIVIALLVAPPAWAVTPKLAAKSRKAKTPATSKHVESKTTRFGKTPPCETASPAKPPAPASVPINEVAKPAAADPDHDRLVHLQEALDGIVHGKVLGRLRVGMRVEDLSSGRALYGWRSGTLMDPASNQKVLGTASALLRLGSNYHYRTEVTGAEPDAAGVITGDLVIRGSGDPSLRARHIDVLAESLATQGVTRVTGEILGDPRRIGTDEFGQGGRSPLRVGSTSIEVHVRPGDKAGSRPVVSIRPASDAFAIVNQAETRAKGKGRLSVDIERPATDFRSWSAVRSPWQGVKSSSTRPRPAPPSLPLSCFAMRSFKPASRCVAVLASTPGQTSARGSPSCPASKAWWLRLRLRAATARQRSPDGIRPSRSSYWPCTNPNPSPFSCAG